MVRFVMIHTFYGNMKYPPPPLVYWLKQIANMISPPPPTLPALVSVLTGFIYNPSVWCQPISTLGCHTCVLLWKPRAEQEPSRGGVGGTF